MLENILTMPQMFQSTAVKTGVKIEASEVKETSTIGGENKEGNRD